MTSKMKLVDVRTEGRNYPTTTSLVDKIEGGGWMNEDLVQLLLQAVKQRDAHVCRLIVHIESLGRECCPLEDRVVSITQTENSTHKLTINPVDGRIDLKISSKASAMVVSELMSLALQLTNMELPPVTLRGKIKWNKWHGYECQLVSGSKKFKKTITYKGE
jgi:hypothetical protein